MNQSEKRISYLLRTLTDIGLALSTEKNHTRLLELILNKSQDITNADGGTIYTCIENKELKFEVMLNRSMNIHLIGSNASHAGFNNIALYNEGNVPNLHMLAPYAAISRKTINIKNIYRNRTFDLAGTKKFDQQMGYNTN
ncbi:MAG: hypothetical protein HYX60_00595 [Legionella longbeachae]|nr:hypothetical protein [Legionella longbeachae]